MRKNVLVPMGILVGLAVVLAWALVGPRAALSQPPRTKPTLGPLDVPVDAPGNTSSSDAGVALSPTPDLSKGPAPSPQEATPDVLKPQIVDLAPNIPHRDKAAILIRHKDGRLVEYYLPPDRLDSFKRGLDRQDSIISGVPPLSLMQRHPPTPNATPETAILPGTPPVRPTVTPDPASTSPSSAYPAP